MNNLISFLDLFLELLDLCQLHCLDLFVLFEVLFFEVLELSLKLLELEGYSSEVISKILICLFESLIGGLKFGEELAVSIS